MISKFDGEIKTHTSMSRQRPAARTTVPEAKLSGRDGVRHLRQAFRFAWLRVFSVAPRRHPRPPTRDYPQGATQSSKEDDVSHCQVQLISFKIKKRPKSERLNKQNTPV